MVRPSRVLRKGVSSSSGQSECLGNWEEASEEDEGEQRRVHRVWSRQEELSPPVRVPGWTLSNLWLKGSEQRTDRRQRRENVTCVDA